MDEEFIFQATEEESAEFPEQEGTKNKQRKAAKAQKTHPRKK